MGNLFIPAFTSEMKIKRNLSKCNIEMTVKANLPILNVVTNSTVEEFLLLRKTEKMNQLFMALYAGIGCIGVRVDISANQPKTYASSFLLLYIHNICAAYRSGRNRTVIKR